MRTEPTNAAQRRACINSKTEPRQLRNNRVACNESVIIDALKSAAIDFDELAYDPSRTFRDNGIDSLDVMSLFLTLEEAHHVKFSEQDAASTRTPAELSTALDAKLHPAG